jgi:hypothetical protein
LSLVTLVIITVIAMCLIGTAIWWFDAKVTIPGPFAWVKGLLSWIMVLAACWFIWSWILAPQLLHAGHVRLP